MAIENAEYELHHNNRPDKAVDWYKIAASSKTLLVAGLGHIGLADLALREGTNPAVPISQADHFAQLCQAPTLITRLQTVRSGKPLDELIFP